MAKTRYSSKNMPRLARSLNAWKLPKCIALSTISTKLLELTIVRPTKLILKSPFWSNHLNAKTGNWLISDYGCYGNSLSGITLNILKLYASVSTVIFDKKCYYLFPLGRNHWKSMGGGWGGGGGARRAIRPTPVWIGLSQTQWFGRDFN